MKKLITLAVVTFFIFVGSIDAQMNPKVGKGSGKKMDMKCMMKDKGMDMKCMMKDKGMGMMKGKGGMLPGFMFYQRVAKDINLTDSQLKKIRDLDFKAKEELIDLKAKKQHLELEMKKNMLDDKFNKNDLLSLHKKILDLKNQIAELNFKTKLEMYSVLTDEQRKNLKNLKMQKMQ